jgi:NAD(P)H-flavin reductase
MDNAALPEENKCLGLMIGQYVELHLDGKKRPYNPISRIDEPGQVDFLITDLRKKNGPNSFTTRLLSLTVIAHRIRKMSPLN